MRISINIVVAAILVVIAVNLPFNLIIAVAIFYNVYAMLISLIPMKIRGYDNDGMGVFMLITSEDARRGYFLYITLSHDLASGKRYKDFNTDEFRYNHDSKLNSGPVSYLVICSAKRKYDMGDHEGSFADLSQLNVKKLHPAYANLVKLDMLYYYVVHKQDHVKATSLYNDKQLQKYFAATAINVSTLRTLAAYEYFVEGNTKAAMDKMSRALERIEAVATSKHATKFMEQEYCIKLISLLDEHAGCSRWGRACCC